MKRRTSNILSAAIVVLWVAIYWATKFFFQWPLVGAVDWYIVRGLSLLIAGALLWRINRGTKPEIGPSNDRYVGK